MERSCLDCSGYLLASVEETTEFGICLNDEAFEPFVEELLANVDFPSCRDLVEEKKFEGNRPVCPDFEEAEVIEIDDNSPLGKQLHRLAERLGN
ncbi:MAG: hypothetical protein JRJ12_17005 [Deltaproteobacteria bacterium]|nr:hypothetical protein [Deltaproteobacteria bacterium]MBW2072898.1 hypothetical protein [Deltaproteobacteria bacterium]